MENASKALLIAGGVLLMILVMTFAIYMFNRIGGQTSEFYSKIEQSDIDEFNQNFLKYEREYKDSEDIQKNAPRIQDVVSIINFAKNNNSRGVMPVEVIINSNNLGSNLQNLSKDNINTLLKNNIDKRYKIEITEWDTNSRLVKRINITELAY